MKNKLFLSKKGIAIDKEFIVKLIITFLALFFVISYFIPPSTEIMVPGA